MTTAFAEPMSSPSINEPAERRPEGALWRFWPRAVVVVPTPASEWRDSLTKFCPQSRRAALRPSGLRSGPRPRSLGTRPLTDQERRNLLVDERALRRSGALRDRPRTWGDCMTDDRPCPWVSCSHHLYLEVDRETGALKLNFPHLEVGELVETCSLRVAERRGGLPAESVGRLLNLSEERISQIEHRALPLVKAGLDS